MTEKEALKILLETSYLLTDEQRTRLLGQLDTFTDEQMGELAYVLAVDKKHSLERYEKGEKSPEKVQEELEKFLNNISSDHQ